MSVLENLNPTESQQVPSLQLEAFSPQDNPLSAIKDMENSRQNNASTDEMLGNLLIAGLEDPQPEQPAEQKGQEKTEAPAAPAEKVEQPWDQANKLREQAIQDCRDGKFADALQHRSEALAKYAEHYAKDPIDTPAEEARQKAITTQLNHVFTCALNKNRIDPKWVPPTVETFPNSQDALSKPKIDQTPFNKMIEE